MNMEKILIIILVVLAVGGLAWSAASFGAAEKSSTELKMTPENFNRAMQAQLPDKCQTPEGYTDAEWQEHMSHHPDLYAECFGN